MVDQSDEDAGRRSRSTGALAAMEQYADARHDAFAGAGGLAARLSQGATQSRQEQGGFGFESMINTETTAAPDVVAFGATGISQLGDFYAQNVRALPRYYSALEAGELATGRGVSDV